MLFLFVSFDTSCPWIGLLDRKRRWTQRETGFRQFLNILPIKTLCQVLYSVQSGSTVLSAALLLAAGTALLVLILTRFSSVHRRLTDGWWELENFFSSILIPLRSGRKKDTTHTYSSSKQRPSWRISKYFWGSDKNCLRSRYPISRVPSCNWVH